MMCSFVYICQLAVLCIILCSHFVVDAYNFTHEMAGRCKVHICREGYRYDTFYAVDHNAYKNRNGSSKHVTVEMHIAILAPRDGHILLSTVSDPLSSDTVYEIVIGGGSNTFSELRRMRQKFAKSSRRTPNILSSFEYQAFWIKIYIDGTIEFGKEGEELPLLSYLDPDPIMVNFFSFAAWNGVEAKFFYDCPLEGDLLQKSNSIIVDEPPISGSMKLRRFILEKAAGRTTPVGENGSRVLVTLVTKVLTLDFDVKTAALDVIMAITMVWQDTSIVWNPEKFENIKGLYFDNSELWTPQLTVFNGIGFGILNPGRKTQMSVTSSGHIMQLYTTRFKAWCNPGSGITRWPRDEHTCALKIGPYTSQHQMILVVAEMEFDNQRTRSPAMASDSSPGQDWDVINDSSDWEVTKLSLHAEWFSDSPYHKLDIKSKNFDPDDSSDTKLVVTINLRRRDYSTSVLVYTPLMAMMFVSLLSILVPYQDSRFKAWGFLAQIPITCTLICTIESMIPFISSSIPDVAYVYSCMVFTALAYWIFYVLRDHEFCRKLVASRTAVNVLSSPVFRKALCLPVIKDSENYNSLQECTSASADTEELTGTDEEYYERKSYEDLVKATDRIVFLMYFIFYLSLLFYHY